MNKLYTEEEKKCEHGLPMFQSCDKCGREMVKDINWHNYYTEEQLKQAATAGATNERIHWQRKLKGLRAKIARVGEKWNSKESFELRIACIVLIDELLNKEFER